MRAKFHQDHLHDKAHSKRTEPGFEGATMRLSLDRKSAWAGIGCRADREGDPKRDMGVYYADVESDWNNAIYCPNCIYQSVRLNCG